MTSDAGYTLIELIVVVVIIGVLASISAPTFKKFIAKARQTEAKINLAHIDALQSTYKFEFNSYASLAGIGGSSSACTATLLQNELGFRPKDCSRLRYQYSGGSMTNANASGASADYQIYPGCSLSDGWQLMVNTSNIENSDKVITKCD